MSHLKGQSIWESDNGRTITLENPASTFYVRLPCQPNTGYAWTLVSAKTAPTGSSRLTVRKEKVHYETEELDIRRHYWGKGRFTGESDNAAVLGGGGGFVFAVSPPMGDMMAGKHRLANKTVTLTFQYARPWAKSSHDKEFVVHVKAA